MKHYVGGTARISATFKDTDGEYVFPSNVDVLIKDPSGNVDLHSYTTDAGEVSLSGNVYYYDLVLDEKGRFHYAVRCTGDYTQLMQDYLDVERQIVST